MIKFEFSALEISELIVACQARIDVNNKFIEAHIAGASNKTLDQLLKKLKEALAPMTDDDDFHQEGYRAFLAGLSEDENPYTGLAAEHWSDGWEDAQEDAFPSNRNGRND